MPLDIVHRDVSPQNILVGVDGVSRVLDFGIAKAASRATSTEDGQIKGKTAYMAPEQLQHGAVDRRTDIFAASVVLWELLCGRRLFLADSPAETMSRVLTLPIDPPQQHASEVSSELAAITLRGLDRDPAGRFATAEEMALAIEESIAMPRSKDVGAWVAATARVDPRGACAARAGRRAGLAQDAGRTADLRRRRSHAPSRRRSGAVRTPSCPTDAGAKAPPPPVVLPPTEEGTALSTVQSTSTEVMAPPRRSRVALALAIGGAGALVLALGIGLVLSRTALGPSRGDTPPVPAAVTLAEPAPSTSSAVPVPSGSPSAPATTVATPSAKPTGRFAGRPAPAPPRPKKACEIPYVIDAKGQKHFRPECVDN